MVSIFLLFLTKCLSALIPRLPSPPPPALKNFWLRASLIHYSFCKTLHLKCLTVLWIGLCPGNCSVISKMTVLHQTHPEFWHIRHCVCFRYMLGYTALLRCTFMHIETLLRHIQAYSGIFSTLCNPDIFTTLPYSTLWHV